MKGRCRRFSQHQRRPVMVRGTGWTPAIRCERGPRETQVRTLPARPRPSHTSQRTSSVRPPMRSRPHVPPRRKERARAQGDSSAGGSASSSERRSASSYSTTSGCGTTSAGRCSTARRASGRQHCPRSASVRAWARPTAWRATARTSPPRPIATSHSRRCAAGGARHTAPSWWTTLYPLLDRPPRLDQPRPVDTEHPASWRSSRL
jgi:hypothetical protein